MLSPLFDRAKGIEVRTTARVSPYETVGRPPWWDTMLETDLKQPAALSSPETDLLAMMLGVAGTQLIGLAAQLGIADLLDDLPRPIAALAEATGMREQALLQAMRALAKLGVFAEPEPGYFTNTAVANLLRADAPNSLRDYAVLLSSGMMFRGRANLRHALETNEGALDDALGMEVYARFQQHPGDAAMFDAAMSSVSRQEAIAIRKAYDFSQFDTLIDVGGGRGLVLARLLETNLNLCGVLCELPNVAESAHPLLGRYLTDGRCRIEAGDFCTAVPTGGADYLLKRVFVVLDDDRARRVLRNCRDAIAGGGRLLVAEPDPSTLYGRLYDVFMLMAHGTGLRAEAEMPRTSEKVSAIPIESTVRPKKT